MIDNPIPNNTGEAVPMPDDLVWKVARAISVPEHHTTWDTLTEREKDLFYMQAEYAIAALRTPEPLLKQDLEAEDEACVSEYEHLLETAPYRSAQSITVTTEGLYRLTKLVRELQWYPSICTPEPSKGDATRNARDDS